MKDRSKSKSLERNGRSEKPDRKASSPRSAEPGEQDNAKEQKQAVAEKREKKARNFDSCLVSAVRNHAFLTAYDFAWLRVAYVSR